MTISSLRLLACVGLLWAHANLGAAEPARILIIAGKQSHGPGDHEFRAGSLLLKAGLDRLGGVTTVVASNGWPSSLDAFNGVAAVVIYADGGGGHPAIQENRLHFLDGLSRAGVGLGFMHYGVEVPKGDPGQAMQRWIGGYYEHEYSCNPMWSPEFSQFPDHPVARGVKPFSIRDEWYFNMRFREDMKGVTSILSAVPSEAVRNGPYVWPKGPYPHIQSAQGRAESMMWVREREDGGRGFGFTGGHIHRNWGNESFRKVILNGLLWIARQEVPAQGVDVPVSDLELAQNLDPKGKN
ncbi:MAG: ThuA domain-containing protein [Verrucomicrobiales bacterium]|nr:ThuA domain-containing protein [Verrucomicrobiales bacterium]